MAAMVILQKGFKWNHSKKMFAGIVGLDSIHSTMGNASNILLGISYHILSGVITPYKNDFQNSKMHLRTHSCTHNLFVFDGF